MIDFSITEDSIANSRAQWEPTLRQYAAATTHVLRGSRKLPIHDQAVELATDWLRGLLARHTTSNVQSNRTFILGGDEHLDIAFRALINADDHDFIFIFREAYYRWLTSEFHDAPWFWNYASWAINSTDRLLEIASPHNMNLRLDPNLTYLLSESGGCRGVDSILRVVDGNLTKIETFCEWVVS
ncbi:hypothetical protein LOC67_22660 [Stieleria sp. JC731]|uniref:hypothetical protein n=1 Tax=Stieleria sp. JC731 TaxID=2894195 RepID=UPI001E3E493A|nr:hypothetical protein [Stieleria sp. JC731]MCC9603361.1 hypothetical protein [Stieleria sp. JC731]